MSDDINFEDAIEDLPPDDTGSPGTGGTAPVERGHKFTLDDFYAVAPDHKCLHRATRKLWPNAAVDARVDWVPRLDAWGQPKLNKKTGEVLLDPPSLELARKRSVVGLTWLPGAEEVIRDKIAIDCGFVPKAGAAIYNLYLPANDIAGDAAKAGPWIEHVRKLFPKEAEHILGWMAHRIQRPGIKPNFGILLIGPPKIGKDTILVPLREGVGPWNYKDVSLNQMTSAFNDYLCAVVLRISEARDSGDAGKVRIDRYALHDHLKPVLASPPETFRINRKHVQEYAGFNVVGVIITTNHQDALYLPEDDRRLLVANSPCKTGEFSAVFFDKLYHWYYDEGGIGHVIAFLKQYDLAQFNAYAAPPKTDGFWNMVAADQGTEHGELLDAIDALGKEARDKAARERGETVKDDVPFEKPEALTLGDLVSKAPGAEWMTDRKLSRSIPHRLRRCGYERVPNPNAERASGMWTINSKRSMIYARADLNPDDRLAAARRRCDCGPVHDRKATMTVVSERPTSENAP
jgi:hypothetical protein